MVPAGLLSWHGQHQRSLPTFEHQLRVDALVVGIEDYEPTEATLLDNLPEPSGSDFKVLRVACWMHVGD